MLISKKMNKLEIEAQEQGISSDQLRELGINVTDLTGL